MTFQFSELSAAIGYATAHYENHPDSDLDEALSTAEDGALRFALNEFLPVQEHMKIAPSTMAALVSHLDVATKEYQSDRDEE